MVIFIKAVVLKDKKKFEVLEVNDIKKDNENVIIEVIKAGICGSDIHNWETGEPNGLILGHEYVGKVIDNGNRNDLQIGDRVTSLPISPCNKCKACLSGNVQYCEHTWENALGLSLTNPGAYSERVSVNPNLILKVPDNVSDDEAAMIEPAAVGLHAVHLANITVGQKVLVVGGGIIGLVSAMFAKMEGASLVVVSETNFSRGKKAIDLGVSDKFLDARDENFVNNAYEISKGGFDVVLECCGNSAAVSSAVMACRPGGKVILVGVATEAIMVPTVMAVLKEISLQGAIAYTKEEFEMILNLMSNKKIDVKKFVSDTISLENVQDAFLELTSGNSDKIKILIDPKI